MTSLLDIGNLSKEVTICGVKMEVHGLSGEAFLHLLNEFPELRKVMGGATQELNPNDLMAQVPQCIAAVIATATGTPGDKNAEAVARKLPLGEQADALKAIWELTFPKGVQSFMEALASLKGQVGGSGWDQATPSPEQSSTSLPADIPEQTSGDTPQK